MEHPALKHFVTVYFDNTYRTNYHTICIRPPFFFYFLFYRFFSKQVRGGGRNKNKMKIHSDHFPIELKSKETQNRVSFDFYSIGKWSERILFLFY